MNSQLKHADTARLLSEVPAEELAAIAGGDTDILYNYEAKVGVTIRNWGMEWTNANGTKGFLFYK